jgi:hypothetical protein
VRPSVSEQLDGLRRILQEVVAPELTDPYPADILAGVCATLETLAAGWSEVPAFLRWDAEAASQILSEVLSADAPKLDESLAVQVREALASPLPDPADFTALQAHHRQIRAALELTIPVISEREELRETRTRLVELFRERVDRYPLKTVWRPSAPAPTR